ncbi:MAG: UDP-N-acetylmuramoylalanine--D-glutamate ligase [Candidatus Tokpelaia sp. JSC189]|nr:MAG: UDP-N-acetylmuramoylalanine--D-glutamate ligase [Candidatus Tokpelaia sp. JSC189]
MIPVQCFRGKKIVLFGLGDSGLATARALVAGGAAVILWDDNTQAVTKAREQGFDTKNLHDIAWKETAALILSPGVPLTHPEPHWSVKLAAAHNVEVIGDIELFVRERNAFLQRKGLTAKDCPFIAITGTNGKSTTTALITYLLSVAGYDVQMGGNIGTAILLLEPPADRRFYVIECSSYQIDLTPSLVPTIGILLNLTPDHIDRHGNFKHYAAIKERLVEAAQTAIISVDDIPCRKIYECLKTKGKYILPIAVGHSLQDGYFAEGKKMLVCGHDGSIEQLASIKGASLFRGIHNMQNVLAALACCHILKIAFQDTDTVLASFQGLSHRMEEVRRKEHILFINDSKATNAEAAASALSVFDHIYWIAGGMPKEGGIHILREFFPKIRKAYLIGEAAAEFIHTIGKDVPVFLADTLANALRQAVYDATQDKVGDVVVLLSPACASFDQFANYRERGDMFRKFVQEL